MSRQDSTCWSLLRGLVASGLLFAARAQAGQPPFAPGAAGEGSVGALTCAPFGRVSDARLPAQLIETYMDSGGRHVFVGTWGPRDVSGACLGWAAALEGMSAGNDVTAHLDIPRDERQLQQANSGGHDGLQVLKRVSADAVCAHDNVHRERAREAFASSKVELQLTNQRLGSGAAWHLAEEQRPSVMSISAVQALSDVEGDVTRLLGLPIIFHGWNGIPAMELPQRLNALNCAQDVAPTLFMTSRRAWEHAELSSIGRDSAYQHLLNRGYTVIDILPEGGGDSAAMTLVAPPLPKLLERVSRWAECDRRVQVYLPDADAQDQFRKRHREAPAQSAGEAVAGALVAGAAGYLSSRRVRKTDSAQPPEDAGLEDVKARPHAREPLREVQPAPSGDSAPVSRKGDAASLHAGDRPKTDGKEPGRRTDSRVLRSPHEWAEDLRMVLDEDPSRLQPFLEKEASAAVTASLAPGGDLRIAAAMADVLFKSAKRHGSRVPAVLKGLGLRPDDLMGRLKSGRKQAIPHSEEHRQLTSWIERLEANVRYVKMTLAPDSDEKAHQAVYQGPGEPARAADAARARPQDDLKWLPVSALLGNLEPPPGPARTSKAAYLMAKALSQRSDDGASSCAGLASERDGNYFIGDPALRHTHVGKKWVSVKKRSAPHSGAELHVDGQYQAGKETPALEAINLLNPAQRLEAAYLLWLRGDYGAEDSKAEVVLQMFDDLSRRAKALQSQREQGRPS